jgi:hypothetical protein
MTVDACDGRSREERAGGKRMDRAASRRPMQSFADQATALLVSASFAAGGRTTHNLTHTTLDRRQPSIPILTLPRPLLLHRPRPRGSPSASKPAMPSPEPPAHASATPRVHRAVSAPPDASRNRGARTTTNQRHQRPGATPDERLGVRAHAARVSAGRARKHREGYERLGHEDVSTATIYIHVLTQAAPPHADRLLGRIQNAAQQARLPPTLISEFTRSAESGRPRRRSGQEWELPRPLPARIAHRRNA